MSAPDTAAAMRQYASAGEVAWVWRMLLQGRDHLALILAEADPGLVGSWEAQPGNVGTAEWDALLAALTCHEFDDAGLPAPGWSRIDPLARPWSPEHPFLDAARVHTQTPPWLARLNIYVPERDLVTA